MKVEEVSNSKSAQTVSRNQSKAENVSQKSSELKRGQSKGNKESQQEITKKEVKEGIEQLNEAIQTFHEDVQFELHEDSGRMMTKIVNLDKHEVIREIPPKEVLEMLGRIKDMVGLILDEKI
ncbi:flagellar protein FlaG [Sporohalobacter salinus]|uniref:flagellar protein FlaG n=1 Tax=Sporohalobacter salinus TaxID=1494606 RepID=UPI00195FC291|nr:flagellar protein FlaG [Sporohalobacter salinus]